MKKVSLVVLMILLSPQFVLAQTSGADRLNRVTFLNKITDSMATIGKSPTEKKRLKSMRQQDRRYIRGRAQEYNRNKNAGKTINREQKKILNKFPKGKTSIGL